MQDTLRRLLRQEWPDISGGRTDGHVFWCQVDSRDIRSTYERVVRVVAALAGVGSQGHEIWINLTGGNNVINFGLELAATLSGDVARLYYVQAENRAAENCVRFTAENGYWIELPVMPLALGRLSRAVLDLLGRGPMSSEELYGTLCNQYWDLSRGLDSQETLEENYLKPLWKQGLMAEMEAGYTIGPQWELIQPYEEILQQARQANLSLEQLALQVDWLERKVVNIG